MTCLVEFKNTNYFTVPAKGQFSCIPEQYYKTCFLRLTKMPSLVRRYVLQLTLGTYCEEILLHYSYYLDVLHSFHDCFLCLLGKCA